MAFGNLSWAPMSYLLLYVVVYGVHSLKRHKEFKVIPYLTVCRTFLSLMLFLSFSRSCHFHFLVVLLLSVSFFHHCSLPNFCHFFLIVSFTWQSFHNCCCFVPWKLEFVSLLSSCHFPLLCRLSFFHFMFFSLNCRFDIIFVAVFLFAVVLPFICFHVSRYVLCIFVVYIFFFFFC